MLFLTYMIFFYLWDSKEEALNNVNAALFHTMEANTEKLKKELLGFLKIISKRLNNDGRIWVIVRATIQALTQSHSRIFSEH